MVRNCDTLLLQDQDWEISNFPLSSLYKKRKAPSLGILKSGKTGDKKRKASASSLKKSKSPLKKHKKRQMDLTKTVWPIFILAIL